VDLGVDDIDKAIAFYSGLFGWTVDKGSPEAGGYANCFVDGSSVAGIGPKMAEGQPTAWMTYLAAEDVDKVAGRIAEAGGRVQMEPFEVMDLGRMVVALDPAGAVFGVWQGRVHTGVQRANEASTMVWNEQLSEDLEGSKRFYEAVFGYTYDDVESMPYAMLKVDGAVAGGLGVPDPDMPAGTPPHWRVYFQVPDTDAAVTLVTELGGQVLTPAVDTPYGRLALVADDQGATFLVIQGS
jgi:predicted enzyme related to lactoylglutathione lyase